MKKYLLLSLLILSGYCTPKQKEDTKKPLPNPKVVVNTRYTYPQSDSAGKLFYKLAYHTPAELTAVKQDELAKWQISLKQKYDLDFKTKQFDKYFHIAYRCTDTQESSLEWVTTVFFKDIYPRYFLYEPLHPFQIVYFKDKQEFTKYTQSTAYGFYQPTTKTLFTYTNSGEGTLWHELIHAFVDANIDHPIQQWFSEGFASFYEMGGIHDNKFVEGYTNWRLPLLQKMLQRPSYLPLPAFMQEDSMTEEHGYAKARFIFCYLWRYNKMEIFVKKYLYELSANYKKRRLGEEAIATLAHLVGKDIKSIEREYKQWAIDFLPFQKMEKLKK